MKNNVLFIYRGQVMKSEFLPEYEKYSVNNCVLLVEKGKTYHLVGLMIKRLKLSITLMTYDDLFENRINMKFDNIIGNPPYSRGLHLKIIKRAFDLLKDGGLMSVIHPASFALGKNTEPNQNYKDVIKIVENYNSTITLFNPKSKFDNIDFDGVLSITTVIKESSNKIKIRNNHLKSTSEFYVNGVDEIYHHGSLIPISVREKIRSKSLNSLNDRSFKFVKNSPLWVKVNYIAGHLDKDGYKIDDYYCLMYKQFENDLNSLISENINDFSRNTGISVNTYDEGINMLKYFKTKFCRFALSLNKIGTTIWTGKILDSVPYMDFSREWTDKQLYDYFDLTEEEVQFIESFIPKFYND